jgi:hypothetical protein
MQLLTPSGRPLAVSRKAMERDLVWMQSQMDRIGERARETTACDYTAYGHGVTTGKPPPPPPYRCPYPCPYCTLPLLTSTATTGKHVIRKETFSAYSQLLRVPQYHVAMPTFLKPKQQRKREAQAKHFFNAIDTDHSGELTRYELQCALEDYSFPKEEQDEVFRLLEGSSTVRLPRFIRGMMEGDVSFAGRESKSRKSDSYLEIGRTLANRVTRNERPSAILSISPGLFGVMHKMFCDFALTERLASFDKHSCVYAAPQLSVLASEQPAVHKSSVGINTRFAVVNPFDKRVLAATAYTGAAVAHAPHVPPHSPRSAAATPDPAVAHTADESPAHHASRGATANSRLKTSPAQAGSRSYKSQSRTMNPGLLQERPNGTTVPYRFHWKYPGTTFQSPHG